MTQYGTRLMPQALDSHSKATPNRLYASVSISTNVADGFQDITCEDMARCVNFMAHWIVDCFGASDQFETLAYVGIPDLRSAAVFLGAVKAGYKVLLPSPRNPPATNVSLLEQTSCLKILYAAEVAPVIKQIVASKKVVVTEEIDSFEAMLSSSPNHFHYNQEYSIAKDDPVVVLHSSGSTGLPKPITMTHATFAVLDRERDLPRVSGRKNRDYSIWDFKEGGRFYTVFPYFHLAGFLSLLVNPIFTELSSPVLGPPLMPPSGALLKEVMKHQKLRALYLPPSIAEQLLAEPDGIDFFKELDFLCYTGGPFSSNAGRLLSTVTELCPLYGSTEAFQVPQLAPGTYFLVQMLEIFRHERFLVFQKTANSSAASPEDWAWMEWNPHFKVDMQPSSDEEGAFELVLFADATTEKMSALNHNLPGIPEYRTKDLFKQHPEKPGLWRYSGRRDDIIVLSNGEKFNPVPMELMIQGHPALSGALVVGMGRIQAGLLVEVKPEFHEHGTQDSSLMEEIWPVVEMANQLVPGQGRIMPNKILVSGMTKPFIRAGKGTIVRRLTERLYEPEIESLYAAQYNASVRSLPSLQPTMKPVFEMSAVLHFVRSIIMDAFPEMKQLSDDDNLFSYGLDSLKMSQLVDHLKTALKATSKIEETYWIDSRLIYQNPSILKLSDVVYQFLNTGTQTGVGEETTSRTKKMDDLVSRYTEGLINNPGRKIRSDEPSIVAVIGSTGYLGPHIVASLLKYPSISKIYCLNRGKDAEQRTISALIEIGHLPTEDIQRLRFMVTDLGEPELGLEETNYAQLNSVVDAIIFNSWYPNFSLPLQSFEFPFLRGLRAIIDWSASSERHPLIAFVSSIAAVGNWPKVYPHQQIIPEKHAEDSNVALNMGYGESKCVAEQILARASKVAGVDVAIIRAGQIGGTASPNLGLWPVQGWLFALAKTANSLGVFPAQVSPLDWIPVDAFAAAAANIARSHGHFKTVRVFNVVHPNPVPWNLFFSTLQKRFGLQAAEVSLPQFLDRLHHATSGSDAKSLSDLETMKIYDFLRSLGDGREGDMKCQIDNAASVSEAIPPITEELLVAWLKTWDLKLESVKLNM